MNKIICTGLLLYMATSCAVINKVAGIPNNPEPNLKSVHMAMRHDGYTKEDYDAHHNHDCDIKCETVKCKQ